MIKLFVTGDNHIGKKYDRYPEIKDRLIQSRLDSLSDMVKRADEEGCSFFLVAGDLFDNINTVRVSDVKAAAKSLASFSGTVLVLPGNHDYYTGEEKVWRDFENALSETDHHVILLKRFREYSFDEGEEHVVFYPAPCQAKHSRENNLDWIKASVIPEDPAIRIGIAHGAIRGVTPDLNEEYFLMTENELEAIPLDAWVIGHTHIPYPETLKTEEDTPGFRIFNAGTHEQTDLHNRTEGVCFLLTIKKEGTSSEVLARKYVSGKVRFYDLSVDIKPKTDHSLSEGVRAALEGLSRNSVVRLRLSGTAQSSEYREKEKICGELLKDFLSYETDLHGLNEEITEEEIRTAFSENSFAALLLERLTEDPAELQMAYRLLEECREEE